MKQLHRRQDNTAPPLREKQNRPKAVRNFCVEVGVLTPRVADILLQVFAICLALSGPPHRFRLTAKTCSGYFIVMEAMPIASSHLRTRKSPRKRGTFFCSVEVGTMKSRPRMILRASLRRIVPVRYSDRARGTGTKPFLSYPLFN